MEMKKFNPWLLYNEKIVDFIRWGEVIWLFSSLILGWIFLHWWGIIVALILNGLNHLQGGPMVDIIGHYPPEERKKLPCSADIKDCRFCGNGYSHSFNIYYQKRLKWWEKII